MSENTNLPMKLSEATMPLSQAIRLGAMLRPHATGRMFRGGASCAQGAAIEALGIESYCEIETGRHTFAAAQLRRKYPNLPPQACPAGCQHLILNVVGQCGMISHLNDHMHSWTREAIADWVESIEQAQSSALVLRSTENIDDMAYALVTK